MRCTRSIIDDTFGQLLTTSLRLDQTPSLKSAKALKISVLMSHHGSGAIESSCDDCCYDRN